MNLRDHWTSLAAYFELNLAREQQRTAMWIWKHGAFGSTQAEAEHALRSNDAHKRFAELEEMWFIRDSGLTRPNPRTGKQNRVYIGCPTVLRAISDSLFHAHLFGPLFARVEECTQDIKRLENELRLALREKETAKEAVYRAAQDLYGPDWPPDDLTSGVSAPTNWGPNSQPSLQAAMVAGGEGDAQ